MIDGKNLFHQPVKTAIRTYENIQKITTRCLLDYN